MKNKAILEFVEIVKRKYLKRITLYNKNTIEMEIYGIENQYLVSTGCLVLKIDLVNNLIELTDLDSKNKMISQSLIDLAKKTLTIDETRTYYYKNHPKYILTYISLDKKYNFNIYIDEQIKNQKIIETNNGSCYVKRKNRGQ